MSNIEIGDYVYEEVLGRVRVSKVFGNGQIEVEANNITVDGEQNLRYFTLSKESITNTPLD